MGWENRNGHTYFYRKRREGNRVVSEYIGRGEWINSMLWLDQLDRSRREQERVAEMRKREELEELSGNAKAVMCQIRQLTHAVLLVNGYHTHKGQWRKRRE